MMVNGRVLGLAWPWLGLEWRCSECGHKADNNNELLTHIWTTHAKQAITENPTLVEALWRMAARQHLDRLARK